jgi:hypothetical protein
MLLFTPKYHNLVIGRNVHSKMTLDGRSKALPARRIANRCLESRALAFERAALAVELRQARGLINTDRPAPHDRQCNEHEKGEDQGDQGSAP